jgi:NAD(P)-dependent dehydrogenase (short-subunit alcohol dehydrogenase family)
VSSQFDDTIAVVSGVSDRGIGGAIVERLADDGATPVLLWHQQRPEKLIRRLTRSQGSFLDVECDVTQQESVNRAVEACLSRFGRIDVLVNNAGVETAEVLESLNDEQWTRTIDVNLTGAMRLTRAVLPNLSTDGGVVINIASVLGIAGCAGFSAYSASKAGLIGMTQSLAIELAPRRQRAVCIAPALVHTPMVHKHIVRMTPEERAQVEGSHPLGIGQPHDVAAAVAFLASQEARWITGVTLPMGWVSGYQLPLQHFLDAASPARQDAQAMLLASGLR